MRNLMNLKGGIKKLLSMLTVFALVLSLLPMTGQMVFAEDYNEDNAFDSFTATEECPYVIEIQTNGNGSAYLSTVINEGNYISTEDGRAKMRFASDVNQVCFALSPNEGNRIDGIRIQQEETSENLAGFVDLEQDERYQTDEENTTFTIFLNDDRYSTDGGSYRYVFINFDFYDENQTDEDGIEVSFNCEYYSVSAGAFRYTLGDKMVAVAVSGAEADAEGKKVLVSRNDISVVEFIINGFDPETMQVVLRGDDGFCLPLNVSAEGKTTLGSFDGDHGVPQNVSFCIELKNGFGEDEMPWYTVSWSGGNVSVENGTVLAERVYVPAVGDDPAMIYTINESEVNADNNIYYIWDTIGKQRESDEEPDSLEIYGLGFSQSDLFISNNLSGISIDYRFVPNYGYQLKNIYTNENQTDSCLSDFTTDDEVISTFTFEVRPNENVHFCVFFEKTEDTIVTSAATSVNGASIGNGGNAVDSGNLSLNVVDTQKDTTVENVVSTFDLSLDNVISKGEEKGSWIRSLSELDDPITITLVLDTTVYKADEYEVVREHDGSYEKIDADYDAATGKLSFDTDKFSTYSITCEGLTPTPTEVPTATPTEVPTATPTEVPTATPTPYIPSSMPYVPAATPTPTATPVPTATPAPTATPTATPVVSIREDGSSVETTTTKSERTGSLIVDERIMALDGTFTESRTVTKENGTIKQNIHEEKPDGTVTNSETITREDGSSSESTVINYCSGAYTEIDKVTKSDGSYKNVIVTTEQDGTVKRTVDKEYSSGTQVSLSAVTMIDGSASSTKNIVYASGATKEITSVTTVEGLKIENIVSVSKNGTNTIAVKEYAVDGSITVDKTSVTKSDTVTVSSTKKQSDGSYTKQTEKEYSSGISIKITITVGADGKGKSVVEKTYPNGKTNKTTVSVVK